MQSRISTGLTSKRKRVFVAVSGAAAAAAVLGGLLFGSTASSAQTGSRTAAAQDNRPAWLRLGPLPATRAARQEQGVGMGLVPSSDEDFAQSKRFRIAPAKRGTRPTRVILTDYLPPVRKQGRQNSCVGWSTAYYMSTYTFAKSMKLTPEQLQDPRYQFSPSFIYHLGNQGNDRGMRISRGFEILREQGCATMVNMPYNEQDTTTPPAEPAVKQAVKYRAANTAYLFSGVRGDTERLKTFLADMRQPFVMAIPIFSDFPMKKVEPNFVYDITIDPARKNMAGFHAVTIVGYDEDLKAFRMVNSWGPAWGDNGFIWLAESFVKNYGFEAWAHVYGGPGSRGAKLPERIKIEAPAKTAQK